MLAFTLLAPRPAQAGWTCVDAVTTTTVQGQNFFSFVDTPRVRGIAGPFFISNNSTAAGQGLIDKVITWEWTNPTPLEGKWYVVWIEIARTSASAQRTNNVGEVCASCGATAPATTALAEICGPPGGSVSQEFCRRWGTHTLTSPFRPEPHGILQISLASRENGQGFVGAQGEAGVCSWVAFEPIGPFFGTDEPAGFGQLVSCPMNCEGG